MAYEIHITDFEMKTVKWLAERGYDCGLLEALESTDRDDVYAIPERAAWGIQDASDCPDSGFACLRWDSDLGRKIRAFLDAIV